MNISVKIKYLLRSDFLRSEVSKNKLTVKEALHPSTLSFIANKNPESRLYFWQLYSLLGDYHLKNIITLFYTSIFNDDEASWFKEVFINLGSLEHHINRQYLFWMDTFAGGLNYSSGLNGLKRHHDLAKEIMTEDGAKRWMFHMRLAIENYKDKLNEIDKRITPCIYEFIRFTMEYYGVQYDFNVINWIHRYMSKL
jgi:truncated hemoglobin YjbI